MRAFLFLILSVFSFSAFCQTTITTNTLTQTSFCAGGNIIVQYSSTGTFPIGCTFNAELSDATGNFANPFIIGSMPLNTGVIAGTIPSNTTFGFGYRVRVTATNPVTIGSTSSTTLIITSTAASATIVANPTSGVCQGDSVSLWVTFNASYYWSTGETTQTIYVTQSGVYTCTVTNFLTGCEVSSNPKSVVIHPSPDVNLGPDANLCAGAQMTMNAGNGYSSYLWNNSSTGQTMAVTGSGIYWVMVTDTNGCKGGDTLQAVYHMNPTVNLGADTSLCGNTLLLSAGMGFEGYNWNNGLSFNPTYLVETSGTYSVMVEDVNGCTDRDTITVGIHALPVVSLGNGITVNGTSLTLDGGDGFASYNWNDGAGTGQYFAVSETGNYSVVVTDGYGCHGSDSIDVTIYPPAGGESFGMYPNPWRDMLYIVANENLTDVIPVLYDELGRYYLPSFGINGNELRIDRGRLAGGCYELLIENKEGLRRVGKVVIN